MQIVSCFMAVEVVVSVTGGKIAVVTTSTMTIRQYPLHTLAVEVVVLVVGGKVVVVTTSTMTIRQYPLHTLVVEVALVVVITTPTTTIRQ